MDELQDALRKMHYYEIQATTLLDQSRGADLSNAIDTLIWERVHETAQLLSEDHFDGTETEHTDMQKLLVTVDKLTAAIMQLTRVIGMQS
jgi:hypothetical protein